MSDKASIINPEIKALKTICRTLIPLSPEARCRILNWVEQWVRDEKANPETKKAADDFVSKLERMAERQAAEHQENET